MGCIDSLYTGNGGLYACVTPITGITPPSVTSPVVFQYEALQPGDYHITVAYDDSVVVARSDLEKFLARNCISPETVWRAAAVGKVQWWVNDSKVYLGAHYYSPELFHLHESIKQLGVKCDFPEYMCHTTFGKWRGIPENLRLDKVFMNDFVNTYVKVEIPNIIETSLLEFKNVRS